MASWAPHNYRCAFQLTLVTPDHEAASVELTSGLTAGLTAEAMADNEGTPARS